MQDLKIKQITSEAKELRLKCISSLGTASLKIICAIHESVQIGGSDNECPTSETRINTDYLITQRVMHGLKYEDIPERIIGSSFKVQARPGNSIGKK